MIFKPTPRFDQLDQYLARREYSLALEAITEEIKRRPESFNLLLRQAEILGLAGDREQAIGAYQQLARHYAKEGFYARAIAVNNKILRLDPARTQVTEELAGLIATQQENEQESRRRLDRAVVAPRVAETPAEPPPGVEPASASPSAPPAKAVPTTAGPSPGVDDEAVVFIDADALIAPEAPPQPPSRDVPSPVAADDIPAEQAARERDAGRFFAAFPRPALEELLSSTSVISYETSEVIMNEGDPGTSMFLIADGHVEVFTRDIAGLPLVLATLGPGEFFGEVAMMTGRPRTATVVALDRVTVIETSRDDIDRLTASHPEVAEVIQHFLETRAKATTEKMLTRMRGGRA